MKPSKGILFISCIFIVILLTACATQNSDYSPVAEAPIAEAPVVQAPIVQAPAQEVPSSYSGNGGHWLNTNSSICQEIEIRNTGSDYSMTTTCDDGSSDTIILTVENVNGEERLYENPGNSYGDYMVIESGGYLSFYDNQGIIYSIPPFSGSSSNSSYSGSSSDSSGSSSSFESTEKSTCDVLWDNLELAYTLSGGEDTDLTTYYMSEMVKNGCPPR